MLSQSVSVTFQRRFVSFFHFFLHLPECSRLLLTKMGKARKDLGKLARRAAHQIKGTQPVGWASFIFPSPPIYYFRMCSAATSSRQPSVLIVAILFSCVPGSEERAQKRRVLVHGRCAAIGEFSFGKRLLFSSFSHFSYRTFLSFSSCCLLENTCAWLVA